MGEWRKTTWGDVVTLQRGFDITRNEQELAGAIPVVSSGGILSHHDASMSDGPGVVMGRKGTLGRVYYVDGPYWPHDTTLWVRDFKGNHPRFVYFALKAVDPANMNVGSASPTLNRNHVHPLPVWWPESVAEQQAIAEVLGALDDKIAANERVARGATALADAQFTRAASGVPFSELLFDDVADVRGGGTPKTKVEQYWDGEISWATPTDVTSLSGPYLARTARKITDEGLSNCASSLYPSGSILMTSRATIGAFAVAQQPTAVNQGFIVVNAHSDEHQWWLFHEMRQRVSEFLSYANGATFQELSRGRFKSLPVRLPDPATAHRFREEAGALHTAAANAMGETAVLAATRDELLPLLMSGRLRVADAEKVVSDAT